MAVLWMTEDEMQNELEGKAIPEFVDSIIMRRRIAEDWLDLKRELDKINQQIDSYIAAEDQTVLPTDRLTWLKSVENNLKRGIDDCRKLDKVRRIANNTLWLDDNARLIAAAPDLFDACMEVVAAFEYYGNGGVDKDTIETVKAVIAKVMTE